MSGGSAVPLQGHVTPHLTRSSSKTASMDSTLASSMTQVICSFLMPKPTGTNFAAQANLQYQLASMLSQSLCIQLGPRGGIDCSVPPVLASNAKP